MTKMELVNKTTRALHKVGFKVKAHSPEILVAAGIVGTVTSAVMACKATTKASSINEELKVKMDYLHETAENTDEETYSEDDLKKDTAIVYAQTGLEYVKLYGPSVLLGVLSLSAIVSGHHILRKRNVALAAAYTAIRTDFKDYRGRVIDRFGKELDRELKYNIKAEEVEVKTIDKNGKEKVTKETVGVIDPSTIGDYSRIFDDGCTGWSKDPVQNLMFLKKVQGFATDKLRAQGYLTLNEVYDSLGFDKIPDGQIIGWVYNEKKPIGDNFVDFGLYDMDNERTRAFVNGKERNVLLEFNHDGYILDKM